VGIEENGGMSSLVSVLRSPVCFVSIGAGEGQQEEEKFREHEVIGLHIGLPPLLKEEPLLRDRTALHCAQKFSHVEYEILTVVSILSSET
jgi:hypothetical protein